MGSTPSICSPSSDHFSASISTCPLIEDGVTYYYVKLFKSKLFNDKRERLVAFTKHRYNDFLELHKALQFYGILLPEMPPKSTFRLFFSESFRQQRELGLQTLIQVALSLDPHISCPVLQEFLQVPFVFLSAAP